MSATVTDASMAFEEAIEARERYLAQRERAARVLEAVKSIFKCPKLGRYEILVPVEFTCDRDDHAKHAIAVNGLELIHQHPNGSWDYGEHSGLENDPVTHLSLIFDNLGGVVEACRRFREREGARVERVKEFLDEIENGLAPILIAKGLKK